jgi:hypothetical protein
MTNNVPGVQRAATRITLAAHQGLSEKIVGLFQTIGLPFVQMESARCVRQRMNTHLWGFSGLRGELSDAATEMYRLTVGSGSAEAILGKIITCLELRIPGRGAVYAQDIREISRHELPRLSLGHEPTAPLLNDLSLITGIQSKSGAGENLYSVALKLGAGVPIVALGLSAGVRDRMGLIRITISPEKELAFLLVPSHDAEGLQRLLIEEGHLDRPGGGFLYQTPVRAGMVDPLLRIGRQEHAASIEQIIAAIDDLKKNTAWRKRFFGLDSSLSEPPRTSFSHCEISFLCPEGQSDAFVQEAMQAGAEGATISRTQMLYVQEDSLGRRISCERGILCVPASQEAPVLEALSRAAESCTPEQDWLIQSLPASSVFVHKRK